MSSSHEPANARQLQPQQHHRVWGSHRLEPWFPNTTEKIGEVWFSQPESAVLVKFLFATENLSVQVHPGDAMAQQHGHPRGKTEMWHILKTAPEAKIALGFHSPVTADQVRQAALDGSIMGLLRWLPVHPGETWFIPAGTVHAIGAGVTVCEVQQNSDVTYRLFDYGRGRELHLAESLQAADLSYRAGPPATEAGVQVDCPYFQVSRIDLDGKTNIDTASLVIALNGSGTIGTESFRQGEVFSISNSGPLTLTGQATLLSVLTRT